MPTPIASIITLSPRLKRALEGIVRQSTNPHRLVRRAQLILGAANGKSNTELSLQLELSRTQVQCWRDRWQDASETLNSCEREEVSDAQLRQRIESIRSDHPRCGTTATFSIEQFATHIEATVKTQPNAGWVFIVDQLNTHKSETLVRLVDRWCDLKMDLGEKENSGILQSMKTRAAFLAEPSHRIRFVYVPKHSSWLNQIECWFSILVRRLLNRGNFTSTQDLRQQILDFITYFNRFLAKPFNWKFKGFREPAKTA